MSSPARIAAPSTPTGPLLEVRDIARFFEMSSPWVKRVVSGQPRLWLKAVDGVSFAIRRGETLALVGESGCGKSTVARLITGLYTPTRGSVVFEGVDLAAPQAREEVRNARRRFQMIFQDPYASLNPRWRVRDIIAEPIRTHHLLNGSKAIARRVDELLRQVGLTPGDAGKYPHEFSGGQRQRISIARALSPNPDFLVCDEPTSALDVSVQAQILNLMKDLQQELRLTYLFISHNLAVVQHISDYVGVMYLGRLVEIGPVREIFSRPQHPYTRMLLDAIPDVEVTRRARRAIAGELPNPLAPPSGCAFHPRCPWSNARCSAERPELRAATGDVIVACHGVSEGRIFESAVFAERPESGGSD